MGADVVVLTEYVEGSDHDRFLRELDAQGLRQLDHVVLSPALVSIHAEYSWEFQTLAPDAASGIVGLPDHAMLVVDVVVDPQVAEFVVRNR